MSVYETETWKIQFSNPYRWPHLRSLVSIVITELGGLQPFPRDSNDKNPGGHVG